MIKFFRKIRRSLLSEGKTGKYLKYAGGEIVLVVIGILIALGINNWNENRKNKTQEKFVLMNLYEDLKSDSSQFVYYEQQFKEIDKVHLKLFKFAHYDQAVDSIPKEVILIRRSLFFKQIIDADFKDHSNDIANPKIINALTSYISSIQDMELIYENYVTPLIENKLKPLLTENNITIVENWFSMTNRSFKDKSYEALFSKNLMDKNKFAELVKTDKFQQILLELNLKWNDFYARLNIVIEENNKLRNIIKSELIDY